MTARALLASGVAAGPLYVIVGLGQALTRDGFDPRRHALSLLSNGEWGWIQTANFYASGALVIAGALGARRALRSRNGGTWGPLLLAVYGIGLLGAGLFPADPGQGFPPGTAAGTPAISSAGLMHFAFGGLGFYALIAACLVFARRFASLGERGWAAYSVASGIGFFLAFAAIASGRVSSTIVLSFYAAVIWIWTWHALVSRKLLDEAAGR